MQQRLLKSLMKPAAYPEPTTSVRLVQTHVSFIFLTDCHVYKIKKPVDLGFLNFTTLDRRRFYCNEEVRLNRRLCPDIYLGVAELRESPAGPTFCGDGRLIDYAVKMLRLPEDRMMDRMLEEGRVGRDDLNRIARTIAEFHRNAERGEEINTYGTIDSIRRNWEENFLQAAEFVDTLSHQDLRIIRGWVERFVTENAELFARRVAGGFIRDCDGDIHLENICLTDRVCIFDCIEFNSRFRYSDTAADIAFLLMDLDFHRRRDMASVLLTEYVALSGDQDMLPLLGFYKVYRAFVRGKVESFRLRDPLVPEVERQRARDKASLYFRLARGYVLRSELRPTLFITCGLMGSGKTTFASELAFEMGLELQSSDAVRKSLVGIAPSSRVMAEYGEGLYSPDMNDATYREMLRLCERALAEGNSVVADATFRRRDDRLLFRSLAERYGAHFCIIHTSCPETAIRERLNERRRNPEAVSDGRWEIYPQQREGFESPDTTEGQVILVDTSQSVSYNVTLLYRSLGIL